jgi:hypothetical protein
MLVWEGSQPFQHPVFCGFYSERELRNLGHLLSVFLRGFFICTLLTITVSGLSMATVCAWEISIVRPTWIISSTVLSASHRSLLNWLDIQFGITWESISTSVFVKLTVFRNFSDKFIKWLSLFLFMEPEIIDFHLCALFIGEHNYKSYFFVILQLCSKLPFWTSYILYVRSLM